MDGTLKQYSVRGDRKNLNSRWGTTVSNGTNGSRSFSWRTHLLLCNASLSVPFVWFAVKTKFLAQPKRSITTYKNWDTTLKCDIFGYPFPLITWTRSHKQLAVNRHVINGDTLTIKNTIEDDGGAYICQGENELGNVMAVIWVVVTDEGEPINPTTSSGSPTTPLPRLPTLPPEKKINLLIKAWL